MEKHILSSNHQTIAVYPAKQPDSPLFVSFLTADEAEELATLLNGSATLAAINEPEWEHAFTPWRAPAVFKKTPDFSGGADEYLNRLAEQVLPQICRQCSLNPIWNGLLGYSLAGLFAAYSAYRPSPFSRIASVSGSLWFDGWADFISQHSFSSRPEKAYFSVGDKEKNTKNPRMAAVEDLTAATQQNWQQQGIESVFELNSGGHFEAVAQRLNKAAQYLLEK